MTRPVSIADAEEMPGASAEGASVPGAAAVEPAGDQSVDTRVQSTGGTVAVPPRSDSEHRLRPNPPKRTYSSKPKEKAPDASSSSTVSVTYSPADSAKPKRRRGRPRKVPLPPDATAATPTPAKPDREKRGRKVETVDLSSDESNASSTDFEENPDDSDTSWSASGPKQKKLKSSVSSSQAKFQGPPTSSKAPPNRCKSSSSSSSSVSSGSTTAVRASNVTLTGGQSSDGNSSSKPTTTLKTKFTKSPSGGGSYTCSLIGSAKRQVVQTAERLYMSSSEEVELDLNQVEDEDSEEYVSSDCELEQEKTLDLRVEGASASSSPQHRGKGEGAPENFSCLNPAATHGEPSTNHGQPPVSKTFEPGSSGFVLNSTRTKSGSVTNPAPCSVSNPGVVLAPTIVSSTVLKISAPDNASRQPTTAGVANAVSNPALLPMVFPLAAPAPIAAVAPQVPAAVSSSGIQVSVSAAPPPTAPFSNPEPTPLADAMDTSEVNVSSTTSAPAPPGNVSSAHAVAAQEEPSTTVKSEPPSSSSSDLSRLSAKSTSSASDAAESTHKVVPISVVLPIPIITYTEEDRRKQKYVDLLFCTCLDHENGNGDGDVFGHRIILEQVPFVARQLTADIRDIIHIPGLNAAAVETIVKMFYTRELRLLGKDYTLEDIFTVVKTFEIERLVNCWSLRAAAVESNNQNFVKSIDSYIVKNLAKAMESPQIATVTCNEITRYILEGIEIKLAHGTLLNVIVAWASADLENRRDQVFPLIQHLDLGKIFDASARTLRRIFASGSLLASIPACVQLHNQIVADKAYEMWGSGENNGLKRSGSEEDLKVKTDAESVGGSASEMEIDSPPRALKAVGSARECSADTNQILRVKSEPLSPKALVPPPSPPLVPSLVPQTSSQEASTPVLVTLPQSDQSSVPSNMFQIASNPVPAPMFPMTSNSLTSTINALTLVPPKSTPNASNLVPPNSFPSDSNPIPPKSFLNDSNSQTQTPFLSDSNPAPPNSFPTGSSPVPQTSFISAANSMPSSSFTNTPNPVSVSNPLVPPVLFQSAPNPVPAPTLFQSAPNPVPPPTRFPSISKPLLANTSNSGPRTFPPIASLPPTSSQSASNRVSTTLPSSAAGATPTQVKLTVGPTRVTLDHPHEKEPGTLKRPSNTGTGQRPSDTGTVHRPSDTGTGQRPSEAGTVKGPSDTGTVKRPSDTVTVHRPSDTGTGQRPSDTGTEQRPSEAGTVKGPSDTGTVKRPSDTVTVHRPSVTGTVQRPSDTETVKRPSDAGTAKHVICKRSSETATLNHSPGTGSSPVFRPVNLGSTPRFQNRAEIARFPMAQAGPKTYSKRTSTGITTITSPPTRGKVPLATRSRTDSPRFPAPMRMSPPAPLTAPRGLVPRTAPVGPITMAGRSGSAGGMGNQVGSQVRDQLSSKSNSAAVPTVPSSSNHVTSSNLSQSAKTSSKVNVSPEQEKTKHQVLLFPVDEDEQRYLYAFDFSDNTSHRLHHMKRAREFSCLVQADDAIYDIGGAEDAMDVCIWDDMVSSDQVDVFVKGDFESRPGSPLLQKRRCFSAIFSEQEGCIYAIGGDMDSGQHTVVVCNLVQRFETRTSPAKWEHDSNMLELRSCHASVVLDDCLFTAGGIGKGKGGTSVSDAQALKAVEIYHGSGRSRREWIKVESMLMGRRCFRLVALNHKMYAIGGEDKMARFLHSVEVYDPNVDKWEMLAPMNHARANFGTFVMDGLIYVVGGNSGTLTIEAYNPATNVWKLIPWPKDLSLHGRFHSSVPISRDYLL